MQLINLFASALHAAASLSFSLQGTAPHPPIIIDAILKAISSVLGL